MEGELLYTPSLVTTATTLFLFLIKTYSELENNHSEIKQTGAHGRRVHICRQVWAHLGPAMGDSLLEGSRLPLCR